MTDQQRVIAIIVVIIDVILIGIATRIEE